MLGCIVAFDKETDALLAQTKISKTCVKYGKRVYFGTAFGKEILIVECGVGKVNAAQGATIALTLGADGLLNFGVAGGLDESTEVARLYSIEKVVQYDYDTVQINGGEIGTLEGESENFLPLFVPPTLSLPRRALGTGDRFNDSPVDHALLIRLGCQIREMEAGAIAQVAKNAGVPFTSVKAISDVYGMGSTTEQFKINLMLACNALTSTMRKIVESLS